MSSKEIKSTLKNAKEALKNKEYKDALRHCKTVLAEDKNNYFALVFVGMAAEGLEQLEQAEKAFKRATEAEVDHPQAWQGLAGFYEKRPGPVNDQELVHVYQKLQSLHGSDQEKKRNVLKKLAKLFIRMGTWEKGMEVYEDLIGSEENKDVQRQLKVELTELLLNQTTLSTDQENKLMELLPVCMKAPVPDFVTNEVIQKYLNLLIKQGRLDILMENCASIHAVCPTAPYPLELMIINYMDSGKDADSEFDKILSELTEVCPTSHYLTAGEGFKLYCTKGFIQAKNLLMQGAEKLKNAVGLQFYLASVYLILGVKKEADAKLTCCSTLLGKKSKLLTVSSVGMDTKIKQLQAEVKYQIGTKKALEASMELIERVPESREMSSLKGFIFLKLGKIPKAQAMVDNSKETTVLEGWIEYHRGNYQAAVSKLQAVMGENCTRSEYYLMTGKALWEMWKQTKEKEIGQQCYVSLLKAAKLDPYCSEVFQVLGTFYSELQHDQAKARKCYQKSFDLDPDNDMAGAALCDLLVALDQEDDAYKILVSVTNAASAGCAKWAWLRLGLHQVKHDNPSVAVSSFQSALRADPVDSHVWECLAEAYLHRGSLTAALKAFTKASELSANSLYSLYQIASIKQTLSMHTEAIDEYKIILELSPNYVPALKGLGETYLLLARSHLSHCFHDRARENCEDALMFLTRAATHRPDLSCLWKLMGDACTITHMLSNDTFRMSVDKKLVFRDDNTKDMDNKCSINKTETLELGARCYGKALKCLPECASLWHDLGINFYHQSQQAIDSVSAKALGEKTVNAFKKALSIDQNNHLHWNALGRIYCSKVIDCPDKAQHCFIKSIHAEANNVVAWTNLATLYFKHGNIQLAHEAFKTAQSLEPSYVACWIGQALIAETVGHDDAMDLFRHTNELANHIEGATGYAHWVCHMLLDEKTHNSELFSYSIKQMAAIPAASDALARYLDRIKTNSTAYNMYGLLLEQQGLNLSAAEAYHRCIQLLDDPEKVKEANINYARVLCKLGRLEESARCYATIDELGGLSLVEDFCDKASLFNKLEKWNESLKEYSKAVNLPSCSEEKKSHCFAAMAMILRKLVGSQDRRVREKFLESSQISPPSVGGLFGLCAHGLLTSDMTLTLAVLQELSSETEPDNVSVAYLMALCNIYLEGDWKTGVNFIQRCVHKFPQKAELWQLLSKVLLDNSRTKMVSAASHCAKTANTLDPSLQDVFKLITLAQLSCGHHSQTDRNNNALSSAKQAVHLYPWDTDNWCNLVSAAHGHMALASQQRAALADTITAYLKWLISITKDWPRQSRCNSWCVRQAICHLIGCGQLQEAAVMLKQLRGSGDAQSVQFGEIMADIITGDVSILSQRLMQSNNDPTVMETVLSICDKEGLNLNLDEIFSGLDYEGSHRTEFMCKVLKVYFSFKQLKKENFQNSEIHTQFQSATMDLLNVDDDCSLARLLNGAVTMETTPRKSRYNFHQILDSDTEPSNTRHDISVARRCMLHLMKSERKDSTAVQKILTTAEEDGDQLTIEYFKAVFP